MTIYIPSTIYSIMQGFIFGCEYEISWIGKVARFKDGFILENVKLIQQEVSPASTVLQAAELGRAYTEIINEEGSLAGWKAWCHSHAKMKTFWSGTDVATIIDFDNETPNDNWFLSLEFNHKMEWLGRIDIFHPVHTTITIDSLQIVPEQNNQIIAYCQREITNKVVVKSPPTNKDELTDAIDRIMKKQNNSIEEVPFIRLSKTK